MSKTICDWTKTSEAEQRLFQIHWNCVFHCIEMPVTCWTCGTEHLTCSQILISKYVPHISWSEVYALCFLSFILTTCYSFGANYEQSSEVQRKALMNFSGFLICWASVRIRTHHNWVFIYQTYSHKLVSCWVFERLQSASRLLGLLVTAIPSNVWCLWESHRSCIFFECVSLVVMLSFLSTIDFY